MRRSRYPTTAQLRTRRAPSPWKLLLAALLIAFLVFLTACASTTQQPTSTATTAPTTTPAPTATTAPTATATAVPTSTSMPSGYAVKVYFSHHPESDNDPSKVLPVQRTSPDLGVATFALKQLFLGPTAQEQAQGYYSEFMGNMGTTNYCGDQTKDFTLSLDHRGSKAETSTSTVTICRLVMIPGDLSGGRMKAMITQTLLQFPNIKQVVILNYQGSCFDDLKGDNGCLDG